MHKDGVTGVIKTNLTEAGAQRGERKQTLLKEYREDRGKEPLGLNS